MNARKKEGRSARKQSHFKVQALRTAQNKTRQNLARIRRLKEHPKQEQRIAYKPGGEPVKVSAVLWRKQSLRKARNLQRRTRLLHTKAADKLVLPVMEATAE